MLLGIWNIRGESNQGWMPTSSAEGTRMETSRWQGEVRQGRGIKPHHCLLFAVLSYGIVRHRLKHLNMQHIYPIYHSFKNIWFHLNRVVKAVGWYSASFRYCRSATHTDSGGSVATFGWKEVMIAPLLFSSFFWRYALPYFWAQTIHILGVNNCIRT